MVVHVGFGAIDLSLVYRVLVYLGNSKQQLMVNVQFMGPEIFKKGALFKEEFYLPGFLRPS